jgi:hypothetical protein
MSLQRYLVALLIVSLLAAGGCTDGQLVAPDALGEAASDVRREVIKLPFRGELKGVGAVPADPTRCAPLITAGNSTVGTMTHLGRVTAEHSQCIDPTGVLQDPLTFTDGRMTVTAANGDKLFLAFAGTLIPTDVAGFFDVNNPFQIVGGTGRFEGATGGGTASGSLDVGVPEAALVLNLDGKLFLPR